MTDGRRTDAETTLQVMEIERFAIHDGPGIRSVVFLQGCPLRCPWCANPESQGLERILLYSRGKCTRCGLCRVACPTGAIGILPGAQPVFDRTRCVTCGACAAVCPGGAIRFCGDAMPVGAVLDVVARDRVYYEQSGGGLTVSGGEPFVQEEGLPALLREAKRRGLHTAVETTGQADPAAFAAAEPLVDLFLFDYKHPDATVLRTVTKARAGLVEENLAFLAARAPHKVTLRVPVVPGFNFDEAVLEALYDHALTLGLQRVHLLPYHTLGVDKYEQIGERYRWPEDKMLAPEALEGLRDRGIARGLQVQIGG